MSVYLYLSFSLSSLSLSLLRILLPLFLSFLSPPFIFLLLIFLQPYFYLSPLQLPRALRQPSPSPAGQLLRLPQHLRRVIGVYDTVISTGAARPSGLNISADIGFPSRGNLGEKKNGGKKGEKGEGVKNTWCGYCLSDPGLDRGGRPG